MNETLEALQSTETPSENPTEETEEKNNTLKWAKELQLAHQAMAMGHIDKDRCLLRRDMTAKQNEVYGLPQENLQECEDSDVGYRFGDNIDNSSTVIHNHPATECPDPCPDPTPLPQPCPPNGKPKLPWWAVLLIVLPWIVLACILIGWLIGSQPDKPGGNKPLIGWELDIGSDTVEIPEQPEQPDPVTIQPAGVTE